MSGVIGVVDVVSEVGTQSDSILVGIQNVFYIMALIAVNLAVVNLLPIPALDGGRIFLLIVTWVVEKIIRRKIDPKYEGYIHAVGMILLLAFLAFITFKDIWKLIGA